MSGVVTGKESDKIKEAQFLCSDESDEMQEILSEEKQQVQGSKLEGGQLIPRYGLLSLEAQNTPMYVYDHPALKKITNTAFTDGLHVFVYAGFMRALVKEEDESKGNESGVVPLVLHELMHKLLGHTHRLTQFPKDIANKAEDLVINSKLQLSFPSMTWCKTIRELGLGFKASEAEKYATLAEETVARQLLAERDKKKQQEGSEGKESKESKDSKSGDGDSNGKGKSKEQKGGGKGQGGKGGSSSDGQGDSGSPSDGQGENGDEEWSDMHTMPLEDLIKTLEDAGLQSVLDKLQLPSSDAIEEIAKIEENAQMKQIENIEKAAAQKSAMGGKYPGGHIVDAATERIRGLTEGKLEWKLGLKEWILGGGMRFRQNDDEADQLFYVTGDDMGLDNEIYLGSQIPHSPEETVLCLVDTSGSVWGESSNKTMLKSFLSEILTLKKGVSGVTDTASEVIVIAADTVIRGQPIVIDESNVDEMMENGINIAGSGGTNLAHSLKMALNLEMFKDKKIKSVVYFTDLCDTPPSKKDFEEWIGKISIAFITTPHMMQDEFIKGVKDFARVYPIEEGVVIDLTEDALSQPVTRSKIR